MADYGKKKNDELATLCKERGLPHTGKKADLVKRLEDHDNNASNGTAKEESSAAAASDVKASESKPDTAPADTTDAVLAAETSGEASDAVVAQTKEKAEADKSSEEKAPTQNFSLGLEDRTLDEEIEKRKKRAAKFGLDPSQDETLKQLERAKRFGTTNLPGLLNQALPERAERTKKRGREAKDDKGDRKRSRQRPAQEKEPKAQAKNEVKDGFPAWMTAEDRAKAEKRKAKFGDPK